MKTFKNALMILAAAQLLSMSAAHAAREGSTGTTGGGDTEYDIYELLPRSITIRERFEADSGFEPVAIGKKHCWLIVPCTVWAWELERINDFDRDRYKKRGEAMVETVIGKKDGYSKQLTAEQIRSQRFYAGRHLETRYFWEKEELHYAEYSARLAKVHEAALAQVDFERPRTITNLVPVEKFLEAARHSHLDPIRDAKLKLSVEFSTQVSQILALAKSVVDDATATCNQARYQQLKARIRGFRFGTSKWLEKLSTESGVNFNELAGEFYAKRGRIHQYVAEEVEPFCTSPNGKGELHEGPGGEPVILNP